MRLAYLAAFFVLKSFPDLRNRSDASPHHLPGVRSDISLEITAIANLPFYFYKIYDFSKWFCQLALTKSADTKTIGELRNVQRFNYESSLVVPQFKCS